ncbi:MAG TPA: N-acetyltransferase [Clostridium sp.]|nr:N-acetyltransferase [Clostridium sp.]
MNFEITDNINKEDEEHIFQGLLEYNLARIEDRNSRDIGVYIRNKDGNIVAGLTGDTHGNWLTIKYLWVSEELRSQGVGSEILKQAEEEAKKRGCKYSFLDTFSFQAPEFYKKYGYKEQFALENYPITGKRYYFTKNLF